MNKNIHFHVRIYDINNKQNGHSTPHKCPEFYT